MARCERSRAYESLILQRVAKVKQTSIAEFMGTSEATVSRLIKDLDKICDFLASVEVKAVPLELKCFRVEDIEPYIQLAKRHTEGVESAEQLVWEDT